MVLDAYTDLAAGVNQGLKSLSPDVPPLIQIGIGYPGGHIGTYPNITSVWASIHRTRDYLYPYNSKEKESGGAPQFLDFFKKELIPYVNKNFKTKSDKGPILWGHSYGGYFAFFAASNYATDANVPFKSFIASSPIIGWDNNYIEPKMIDLRNTSLTHDVRLYFTIGSLEGNAAALNYYTQMDSTMNNPQNAHLKTGFLINDGLDHNTNSTQTVLDGLNFIFQ